MVILFVSTVVTQCERVKKNAKLMSAKIYFMPLLPVISHSSQHKTGQYVFKMI